MAYRGRALVELKTELTLGSIAQPERKQFAKDDEIHFKVTRRFIIPQQKLLELIRVDYCFIKLK